MKNYRLHFIRHGMTEGNKRGQYVGRTDQEVSLEGIRQLIHLKETCLYPQVERVYSSPLTRCVQTAGVLYPDAPLLLARDLAEIDFGEFEGKTIDELKDRPEYQQWMASSFSVAPPNGEDGQTFTARIISGVDQIFRQMMDDDLRDVAVITHGGVIMTLLHSLGLPKGKFEDWLSPNGCGFSVAMSAQMWMRDRAFEILGPIPVQAEKLSRYRKEDLFDTPDEEE